MSLRGSRLQWLRALGRKSRFMAGLLFGITATDPPTFFGAAAALLLAALAATYSTARLC